MKRSSPLRQIVITVIPIFLGGMLSAALQQDWLSLPNPAYRVRFDVAWLFMAAGFLITLILAGYFLSKRSTAAQTQQALNKQDQLFEAQHQEFLRRLDHELKNPITIMQLGTSNLRESDGLSDTQRGSIHRISQQTGRLRRLVVDLRRLTELQAADFETAPVDLTDVLTEAITLAQESAQEARDVNLNIQKTPWPVAHVQGDRELLILAFRNLIDNGLKYTADTNQVDVRAFDDGQQVVVEVADNGMGIAADELDHIFENLYRGRRARGIQGSGLGLPLVERIIQLHGGTIEVRSRAETGTVFSVRLPI